MYTVYVSGQVCFLIERIGAYVTRIELFLIFRRYMRGGCGRTLIAVFTFYVRVQVAFPPERARANVAGEQLGRIFVRYFHRFCGV